MAEKVVKITKTMNFEELAKVVEMYVEEGERKERLLGFIEHEKELIARKSSTGNTKKNEEHETIKAQILAVMNGSMTCTEITKAVNAENETEYTSNKISAMLKKMVDEDKTVTKVMDKKTALFSAV